MVEEVVGEVAADMRPARRVLLQQLSPTHPLPPLREIQRQRLLHFLEPRGVGG